ncbi:MAG TPA: hypothetical protein VFF64_05420 [Candidatus Eremiobacteraceae bacterium]|nr:hypothetical protein [Candidatus Eremiobacteraceae bacterium]
MTCSRAIVFTLSFFLAASSLPTAQTAPGNQSSHTSQSGGQSQSPARFSEMKPFEQYVAYWTTEPGWSTELQLRNNLDPGKLTVTPALRMADGTETALPPVTIKSGEVASLDVGDAVLKAAPRLVGTYGSLVLRYRATVHRALYAAVMVRIDGRPIAFHLDAYSHNLSPGRASREGIWWLPRESVSDFLILANAGDQKLVPTLTVYDSGGKAWHQQLSLEPHQTQRLSVRTLLQRAGLSGRYGGIKIDGADTAGYLDSAHLLFDEVGGFSANMKMFNHDPDISLSSHLFGGVKEWTTRAPMLALSDPDPALGFPAGTALQPKVLVRNTSARPFTAHIRFNWRSAMASGKTPPMDLALKPNATQAVDVGALQAQKLIPADAYWAAVVISAPIQPDDLMAIAASYDQTGRYGAQTPFSDQLASHWEGGKWEVDSMHDSLLTAGNGGNKPAKAELTILYNQGSEQYQIEQMLAPDEQMLVDFGKLIRNQVPDKNGHVLPPDLTSGAYRLRDLEHNPVGALYEGKVIVDKTYGHAAYGCGVCCGPDAPTMAFDPLAVSIDDYADQYVQALNSCGGGVQDFTDDFSTWWTGDTAIATANKNSIHGVAAGTTNHYAESDPMYWGIRKAFNSCPISRPQTTANTNVQACPSSSSIGPISPESLSKVLATYKTGLGSVVGVNFSPAAPSGLEIAETLSKGTNTCPQGFPTNVCTTNGNLNTAVLTVGASGTAIDGTPLPATANTLWDEHVVASPSSLLGSSGTCSISCGQQYWCAKTAIGNYTVTYTFKTGTISGTPVTNVTATVQ